MHKQQNGEQLFRLLKSLDEFYYSLAGQTTAPPEARSLLRPNDESDDRQQPTTDPNRLANQAEFASYFILYQIDNGKEVCDYCIIRIGGVVTYVSNAMLGVGVYAWAASGGVGFVRCAIGTQGLGCSKYRKLLFIF